MSEQNIELQRTRNFSVWFGNSKMVDADGHPTVFYHGTRTPFEVFDKDFLRKDDPEDPPQNALGFFFARSKEYASEIYSAFLEPMAVNLKIEKPYYLTGKAYVDLDTREKVATFLNDLRLAGYDGVVIADGTENVVFEPTQIKSTKNRGTFDPKDTNIFH